MSDQTNDQQGPSVRIVAQYLKDLSFENPHAPLIFQDMKGQPDVAIGVNIGAKRHNDNLFEIDLRLKVEAKQDDKIAFMVEVLYGALFSLSHIPDELLEPVVYIECPRLLFPFARRIISDMTRDGGFPPLQLDPIDFAALYQQQQQQKGS